MYELTAHVKRLTAVLLRELPRLKHRNGASLVRLYGPADTVDRGGTIAFNLLDAAGNGIAFSDVERRARDHGVALRGGCFCNPGASEAAFGLNAREVRDCLHQLGNDFTAERFSACAGRPIGAVRISVGLANNQRDIERAMETLASFLD
jgi:selenocysteine lyase/cysteine desulfurase